MIWFTSDLHFGHETIIQYSKRPYADLGHMHYSLIKNLHDHVNPGDTLYILGDMSFLPYKEFKELAAEIPGKKILIKGNHDSYSYGQYERLGFQVFEEAVLKLCGQRVRLSHFPYWLPWHKRLFAFKSELRYESKRPARHPGEFLLHGHTHTRHKGFDRMIHVGVDAWDGKPVSSVQIESIIGKRLKNEIP